MLHQNMFLIGNCWKILRNSSKKEVFEGKCSKKQCPRHFRQQTGAKMAAMAVKMEPRSAQSEPKGVQRTPKGARREPKGRQKGAPGRPRCIQIPMSEKRGPYFQFDDRFWEPFWEPFCIKHGLKIRYEIWCLKRLIK